MWQVKSYIISCLVTLQLKSRLSMFFWLPSFCVFILGAIDIFSFYSFPSNTVKAFNVQQPSKREQGDKYSAYAIYKNSQEAQLAYEDIKGIQKKVHTYIHIYIKAICVCVYFILYNSTSVHRRTQT